MLTAAKWLIHSLPFVFLLLKVKCEVNVSINYVESAVSKGAVCLDGSPPAYHLSRGFGEGINNWLIHLEVYFYNWNRVKVRYCDGSSFTGGVGEVDPVTNLHYRGARVWLAVEDLRTRETNTAENALLFGCSAGGLASILHCDSFRALLPMGTKVKCPSDAGYFIDVKDVAGTNHMKSFFNEL